MEIEYVRSRVEEHFKHIKFQSSKIAQDPKFFDKHFGEYPVYKLRLKQDYSPTFIEKISQIKRNIIRSLPYEMEVNFRVNEILEQDKNNREKKEFNNYMNQIYESQSAKNYGYINELLMQKMKISLMDLEHIALFFLKFSTSFFPKKFLSLITAHL